MYIYCLLLCTILGTPENNRRPVLRVSWPGPRVGKTRVSLIGSRAAARGTRWSEPDA